MISAAAVEACGGLRGAPGRDGSASCRNCIIDAMYRLTPADLEKGANYGTQ